MDKEIGASSSLEHRMVGGIREEVLQMSWHYASSSQQQEYHAIMDGGSERNDELTGESQDQSSAPVSDSRDPYA